MPVHHANANTNSKSVDALREINKGNWKSARALVQESGDPLTSRLYYWLYFTKEKKPQDYVQLVQFIRKHPNWPGISGLRAQAERKMPSSSTPSQVLGWFNDYAPKTARGLDLYIGALLGSGRKTEAKKKLAKWWVKTPLSRDDQKHLFTRYKHLISRSAHVKRFDTLLFSGQYSNARALARVLGAGYPQLAEARISLARKKGNVNALINKVPTRLQSDPGLLYERLRWRRRKDLDDRAMEILLNAPAGDKISNPADWWQERHIMIRRMLEQKRYKQAFRLASTHQQKSGLPYIQAQWLSGFIALRFVERPATAFQYFQAIYHDVKTPISRARAGYWAGRAAAVLDQEALAHYWYLQASRYQTAYYGQTAAAELSAAGHLPHTAPPVLNASDIQTFRRDELIRAARLFDAAGMYKTSGRFLRAFVAKDLSPKAYRYTAELASELGQSHTAIRIAKDATKKGLFMTAQSYPVLSQSLNGVKPEWALVHALIRQESTFDVNAKSPAGARGLMQLMPATAREVARKIRTPHRNAWLTSKPAHNIKLGTTYLQQMLDRFDGSYPLAIAAYNAGPNRVDKWLKTFGDPRDGKISIIDWSELIPIYETRNYVQRVMEGVYVYRLRLKGRQSQPERKIYTALHYHAQKSLN